MSQFASGEAASPSLCERYADEIALLDDPEPETPERGAARAHLAGCERCQRERADMRALSTALSARVKPLMAQAPAFSEAAIAKQAARRGSAGDSRWRDVARTEAGDARRGPASVSPPGGHLTPTRALAPASTWRSRLSAVGSVAAVALITALLAMTLTGHLLGRPGRGNHSQVTAHAAVPLSALTIFSPGYSTPTNGALEPIAYRASDGAPLKVAPAAPIAARGAITADGVRYLLTIANTNLPDANATAPATLSATRVKGGQVLWSERVGAIYTADLELTDGTLYLATQVGTAGVDTGIRAAYAYRASDGALLWTHTLDAQPGGPPVIVQGVVYLVAGQTALALRASAGTPLWQASLQTSGNQQIISAWLTATSDTLYIYASLTSSTGQKDGRRGCLRAAPGQLRNRMARGHWNRYIPRRWAVRASGRGWRGLFPAGAYQFHLTSRHAKHCRPAGGEWRATVALHDNAHRDRQYGRPEYLPTRGRGWHGLCHGEWRRADRAERPDGAGHLERQH